MNKQEAIETIKAEWFSEVGTSLQDITDTISQIDRLDKVEVPKFVAERLESCKLHNWDLQMALSGLDNIDKVADWAYDKDGELIPEKAETFARAWLDGYEVEKEKLYTIEIEGVDSGKLFKNTRTNKFLFHSGKGLKGYTNRLTETEIKQKDERLWQFAKKVE